MKPTIISVSKNGKKHSIEVDWDADIDDMIHAFRVLLFALTFNIDQINEVLPERE